MMESDKKTVLTISDTPDKGYRDGNHNVRATCFATAMVWPRQTTSMSASSLGVMLLMVMVAWLNSRMSVCYGCLQPKRFQVLLQKLALSELGKLLLLGLVFMSFTSVGPKCGT